jgi:hypothetical protein
MTMIHTKKLIVRAFDLPLFVVLTYGVSGIVFECRHVFTAVFFVMVIDAPSSRHVR